MKDKIFNMMTRETNVSDLSFYQAILLMHFGIDFGAEDPIDF